MSNKKETKKQRKPQIQATQPGKETKMEPRPEFIDPDYKGSDKLLKKIAIITGGDSGIGRAVAVAFAIEGADVVISYLNEHEDAAETKRIVESYGRQCLTLSGDVGDFYFCKDIVNQTIKKFKKIDILVNNAGEQHPQKNFSAITLEQFKKTFQTNLFSYFYMIKVVFPFLKKGSIIINTTSVTAYRGSPHLIDYSATKGAIVSLTRSLSENFIKKGIRVNAVAPGPIWTPLIPSSFPAKKVETFGSSAPMKRAGEPKEIAPCYVFLASKDSSYMSGQVLHPNGGEIING